MHILQALWIPFESNVPRFLSELKGGGGGGDKSFDVV